VARGALCCGKRFVVEIWGTFYSDASFTAYGGRSKHQKRTSGIWYGDATTSLRLAIDVTWAGPYTGVIPPDCDNTAYGNNIIEWSFIPVDAIGNGIHFNLSGFTSYHHGVCDDGQPRDCAMNYFQ
jgi:hypothetical protein